MSNRAWNKVVQTHDTFKKIVAPLKEHLGIDFGYMIVFNDGRYYQIIENLECLPKWVTNVETSSIFCSRNVTTYFDQPYNFTIWPEAPIIPAMEIYKEYGMWNGITVSKINKDYTELYWFTKANAEDGWHKWFIRNKLMLFEIIRYFDTYYNKQFCVTEMSANQDLFKFKQGFEINLPRSKYEETELTYIGKAIQSYHSDHKFAEHLKRENIKLSPREIEILTFISKGYPTKNIAKTLNISIRTVNTHIERVKSKHGLHLKIDIIKFFEKHFLNLT